MKSTLTWHDARVAELRDLTPTVREFVLAPTDAVAERWAPGAHLQVRLSAEGREFTRNYSLVGSPEEIRGYRIAVKRLDDGLGGSRAMWQLVVGDAIEVGTPQNHFPLGFAAPATLLVAGGIGITPILCMAERLASSGAGFQMHYCARSRERTAFRRRIEQSAFADAIRFHFDEDGPVRSFELAAILRAMPAGTHVYACGPAGFLDHVLEIARAAQWPQDRVHHEYFSAAPSALPQGAFEVRLASTGQCHVVQAGESVVEALARAGVRVPISCGQGVCGTCLTRVLDGVPDHRDMFLTAEEQLRNDQFAPCCSRAHSASLTLDL